MHWPRQVGTGNARGWQEGIRGEEGHFGECGPGGELGSGGCVTEASTGPVPVGFAPVNPLVQIGTVPYNWLGFDME